MIQEERKKPDHNRMNYWQFLYLERMSSSK